MSTVYHPRPGFTVAEVIVAMFLVVFALGALEGGTAITIRRLRESHQESTAARLMRMRAERLLASPCTASSGIDSSNGVVATWSLTTDRHIAWIDQETRYHTMFGDHIEVYRSAGACP